MDHALVLDHGEEADGEGEDADEEEGESTQHAAQGVPESAAAPGRHGDGPGLELRHGGSAEQWSWGSRRRKAVGVAAVLVPCRRAAACRSSGVLNLFGRFGTTKFPDRIHW